QGVVERARATRSVSNPQTQALGRAEKRRPAWINGDPLAEYQGPGERWLVRNTKRDRRHSCGVVITDKQTQQATHQDGAAAKRNRSAAEADAYYCLITRDPPG